MPTPPPPAIVTFASCPVPFTVLYASKPTLKGQADQGWSAEISFKVAQNDLIAFAQFVAGTPKTYTVGSGTVTRIIPVTHPWLGYTTKMVARSIDCELTGEWTPGNEPWAQQWSDARVKVGFATVPWATDGSTPFAVVETNGASETYTLAGVKMAFSDGTPIQADAGLNVPTLAYSVTIYQAAAIGDDTVAPLLGTINSVAMALGVYTWPIGSVRFDGMRSRLTMTSDFNQAYERGLLFNCRPIHWNKFLRSDGTWDFATPSAYTLSDLRILTS